MARELGNDQAMPKLCEGCKIGLGLFLAVLDEQANVGRIGAILSARGERNTGKAASRGLGVVDDGAGQNEANKVEVGQSPNFGEPDVVIDEGGGGGGESSEFKGRGGGEVNERRNGFAVRTTDILMLSVRLNPAPSSSAVRSFHLENSMAWGYTTYYCSMR
jgi:hypothetical protein